MIDYEDIRVLMTKLEDEINKIDSSALIKFPIDQYVEFCANLGQGLGYKFFSNEAIEMHKALKKGVSESIFLLYHRIVYLKFIERSQLSLNESQYPLSIIVLYNKYFEKIFSKIKLNSIQEEWFDFSQDKFCKEFSILRIQSIPVGPQFVVQGKIHLGFFRGHGISQIFKGLYVVFLNRGIAPVYEFHTNQIDSLMMANFNRLGWERMFLDLAELLIKNKKIKAVFGSAWFFDSKLSNISPEISYIRDYVETVGGFFFKMETHKGVIKDATFMSPMRKKFYEEGKYIPNNVGIIIPRQRLINWSKQQTQL